jgi:hypothetical protein
VTEKLLKGKFILSVLALLAIFALGMADKMDGTQLVLAITAVVGGFLHFDAKAPAA